MRKRSEQLLESGLLQEETRGPPHTLSLSRSSDCVHPQMERKVKQSRGRWQDNKEGRNPSALDFH